MFLQSRLNQKGKKFNFLGNSRKKFSKNISATSESVLSINMVSCRIKNGRKPQTTTQKLVEIHKFYTNYGFSVFQFLKMRVFTFLSRKNPINFMITFLLYFFCGNYMVRSRFYSFYPLSSLLLAVWSSKPSHFRYQPTEASDLETDHTNQIRVSIYPPPPSFG